MAQPSSPAPTSANSASRRAVLIAAVLNMIEAATKPVVAAIHGTALGGGLENRACLSLPRRGPVGETRRARGETGPAAGAGGT